jgi:hypothetical protein
MKSDQLLFAAKQLLLEALEDGGADIVSHAHGSDEASVDFFVDGRAYSLGLTLAVTDDGATEIEPLRPPRPRRPLRPRPCACRYRV